MGITFSPCTELNSKMTSIEKALVDVFDITLTITAGKQTYYHFHSSNIKSKMVRIANCIGKLGNTTKRDNKEHSLVPHYNEVWQQGGSISTFKQMNV